MGQRDVSISPDDIEFLTPEEERKKEAAAKKDKDDVAASLEAKRAALELDSKKKAWDAANWFYFTPITDPSLITPEYRDRIKQAYYGAPDEESRAKIRDNFMIAHPELNSPLGISYDIPGPTPFIPQGGVMAGKKNAPGQLPSDLGTMLNSVKTGKAVAK